jgi:hypothetical protein
LTWERGILGKEYFVIVRSNYFYLDRVRYDEGSSP